MSRASICKYVPGGGGKFSAQPCVCVWQGRGNPRSLLFKNGNVGEGALRQLYYKIFTAKVFTKYLLSATGEILKKKTKHFKIVPC